MTAPPEPCREEPCPTQDLEGLVRCVTLRLARDLGAEEALRLVPALVRALAGAVVETSERRLREQIVGASSRLACLGYMGGTAGNLSVREPAGTVLITPAGLRKGDLRPDDLVRLDMQGNRVGGGLLQPSSEYRVHLKVYLRRPDVNAVVHTHSPFATGFAAAGVPLDRPVLAEAVATLGPVVPVIPFGTPSTWDLADRLEPWLEGHDAFLLANHGVLCLGGTLDAAVHRNETLEFLARVLVTARLLGGERLLSREELEKLASVRKG